MMVRLARPASVPYVATGGGAVTHGSQINLTNTGYGAYFDSGLGRLVTLADLTTTAGSVRASDFVTAGGTITKRRFTGDFTFDLTNVTVRACLFDNPVSSYLAGVHYAGAFLDYCTVSPATVGDDCMHYEGWSANRCYFRGCSDGGKINGGAAVQNITECYIRVQMQSGLDHNDGLQNVGGDGTVNIRRCNIAMAPEGGIIAGGGGPNACVMSADMTAASNFHLEVTDCLLDGATSASTLRFYDGGLTPNITYVATGNRFVRSSAAPGDRGTSNTTPTSQVTWSGNVWDDDNSTIPAP